MPRVARLDGLRREHLERILLWEGRVGSARIVRQYGLSAVRAAEWLSEFKQAREKWLRWDSRERCHYATEEAYLAADRGDVALPPPESSYVGPTASVAVDTGNGRQPRFAVAVLPWQFSAPSPRVFSTMHLAIEDSSCVKFTYRSMAHPEPHSRTIEPHTIVKAGRRWHVRGFCLETEDFRDFVLGRIVKPLRLATPATHTADDDDAWRTMVKVRFIPHPQLQEPQQRVVRHEFMAGTAARTERCRGALVPYLIQEVRAAVDLERQRPPEYQLAVDHPEEYQRWIFPS